jgi:hypothetical protein
MLTKEHTLNYTKPIPLAAPSKAWVCGRSVAEIVGSNSTGSLVSVGSVVCCQVEVFATGWSPNKCGVSEYDREVWLTEGLYIHGTKCPHPKSPLPGTLSHNDPTIRGKFRNVGLTNEYLI